MLPREPCAAPFEDRDQTRAVRGRSFLSSELGLRRDVEIGLQELPIRQFVPFERALYGSAELFRLIGSKRGNRERKIEERLAGGLYGDLHLQLGKIGCRMIHDNELQFGLLLAIFRPADPGYFQELCEWMCLL